MGNIFIKVNHSPIKLKTIIGLRPPYWIEVEVKPKRNTKRVNAIGPLKKKTRRAWGFDVVTDKYSFRIFPTDAPFYFHTNTKTRCLMEFDRIQQLLLNIKNEDKK